LSPEQRSKLRGLYHGAKQAFVRTFLSYDTPALIGALRSLGIACGDTLMVHSGFSGANGYTGSPSAFIDALFDVVGPEGHVLMVSMPYQSSTYDYIQQGKCFDVRKTVSHMGIVSETFRRRGDVLRSLHPTHPVLAHGPRAAWLIADHEQCLYPCGRGTPFDKLAQLHGKVLFFNVSFFTFTFFHHLEELIQDQSGIALFRDEPFELPVIDYTGNPLTVRTYVYSAEANRRRRPQVLKDELDRRGMIKNKRIGNSRLQLVATADALRCVDDMTRRGIFFYA
jgi:aminoglycoside 3-N-acetyltransferase